MDSSRSSAPTVTYSELSTAIESLYDHAAPGMDGISSSIIKSCFQEIAVVLLFIMNACVTLSYFSKAWKTSKVVVIGSL
jgi:hypothetical protein